MDRTVADRAPGVAGTPGGAARVSTEAGAAPRAEAIIDAGRLRRNLERLREIAGPRRKVLAVCKANAYGHGAVEVARALEGAGCDRVGVATVDEASDLRAAGISIPIHLLGPLHHGEEGAVIDLALVAAPGSFGEVVALARAAQRAEGCIPVHLAIDVGMARHGVHPEAVPALAERLRQFPWLDVEGAMGHLPSPQDADETRRQVRRFDRAVAALRAILGRPIQAHVAASAGACRYPFARADLVRSGAFLLGFDPGGLRALGFDLEPVLSLRAAVVATHDLPAGAPVSYGGTFRTPRPTRIATVAAGYADGVPIALSNQGYVLLHGRRAPIRGRVTMDYVMVDVTDIPAAGPGDTATILGDAPDGAGAIPIEDVAALARTIPYEVATGVGPRVRRRVVG